MLIYLLYMQTYLLYRWTYLYRCVTVYYILQFDRFMESPPIIIPRTSNTQRRMSTTSQLFTRITPNPTSRHLKTSNLSRQHLHTKCNKRNQSLQNQKQNINYQKYLYKIKSSLKIDEKQMASNYLLNLRKQYDQMAKNIQIKTKYINIMKKQIGFIRNKSKNYRDSWGCVQDRLKVMGRQIEICKIRQDQEVMQTKILQHIITRMKTDQLQHKTILFNKQLQLKQKKKQLKFKIEQTLHCDGQIHKIYEQIIKIKQQFKKSTQERQFKLREYKDCMHDVQEQQKFQQERKQRSFQLLNIQSNDVMDIKNNVWRDVLLTNQLLDKLLQSKISDLLNHYQELQKSYHLIKTQTNITDPYLMAKRFFSYTQTLQQITSTIRDLQLKQQQLSKQNKILKQRQKQIKIKQLQQQKIATFKKNQIQQEKQKLAEEYLEKQLLMRKINSWTRKISQNIGYSSVRKSADANSATLIQQICNYALKKHQQINSQQISTQKFQSPGVRLKKLIKQFSIQDEKIRRSQAQEINQSNILQNAYLCHERRQVKKNQRNQFLIKLQLQKKPSTININNTQLQKIKQ